MITDNKKLKFFCAVDEFSKNLMGKQETWSAEKMKSEDAAE